MAKSDDLTTIKELLEIVKHKVDLSESHRSVQTATIHLMKDQLSVINKKLDEIKDTQDSHTGSLVKIESKAVYHAHLTK